MDLTRCIRSLVFAASMAALAACDDGPLVPALDDPEVEAFVTLLNQHRSDVGCGALEWRGDVADVARAHSQDMVDRGFFAHTNPDGYSPFHRLSNAGISFSAAAENIAFGYGSGASVLQAWLDSPGHRANIENCGLEQHGVGLVGTHWTHVFVTP